MKRIRFAAVPATVAVIAVSHGVKAEDCCLSQELDNGIQKGVSVKTPCKGDDCVAKPAKKKMDLSPRGINGGEGGDAGGEAGAAD